ncbi:MAG: peroxiredoxin family protein [Aureliella sp.]
MRTSFSRNSLVFNCCFAASLIAGFAVASKAAEETGASKELKVGDSSPKFEMKGSDGKTYQAADFIGKKAVIIAWFPRAFTGGCTKECKSMKEYGDLLKKYEVAYFTASTDTVKKNAEFAKSLELDYPILCDPEGKNARMFGVLREERNAASRVTFVIGKDGKIASIQKEVNKELHGKELAALLKELEVEAAK